MALLPGSRLGAYEIVAAVGAGGMGEVYRARDTVLQRDVAIKVLPELFAADPERLARFEREAQTLAALNHPHIAQIHGVHDAAHEGGRRTRALVMEFVPGEDLARLLARGALPLDEALPIARQIAEALEAAHEQGIIHRDLKPANIMVRPDGTVKVLDFGLAKALDPGAASGAPYGLANSPTFTSATQAGTILGTAAYMAPEQAKGRPVDRRVDIWAFGVVLYEMLTGRQLFAGETVAETIGLIVTREPELARLPAATPAAVGELLRRCLVRDPKGRLRDAGEARIVLEDPRRGAAETSAEAGPRRRTLPPSVIAAIVVVALLSGGAAGRFALGPRAAPAPPEFAFAFGVPGRQIVRGSLALSPDGSHVAFRVRLPEGASEIWLRAIRDPAARALPGTRDLQHGRPFWSPDSRHLGFFVGSDVWRVNVDGTSPRRIATAPLMPRGGAWGAGDVILFGTEGGAIFRIDAGGGSPPLAVTTVDEAGEEMHAWPAFLPDGRQFVFLTDGTSDEAHRIRLASTAHGASKILLTGIRSSPAIDPRGALLVVERGQLMAYPMNFATGTIRAEASLVADGVLPVGDRHDTPSAIAANGVLAYQRAMAGSDLARASLESGAVEAVTQAPDWHFGNPAISPDGRHVAFDAFSSSEGTGRLLWTYDFERGIRTLMSEREYLADSPVWAADSATLYFNSNKDGAWKIYRKAVTGTGTPELVGSPADARDVSVLHCSRDGKYVLAAALFAGGNWDLFLLPLESERGWKPWMATPAAEAVGRFSPDSRWIAYTSSASGPTEVYVSAVEDPSNRLQISAAGGTNPVWTPDGTGILYRSLTDDLMSVTIDLTGRTPRSTAPRALFPLSSAVDTLSRSVFDIAPDGRSIVIVRRPVDEDATIHVRSGVPPGR
ncbi:MAG TPA: LpqB family beta-propeller domain-containing protein [Vicinamibacterales bacterium]|nr:LpqB family beta-propeller domain-containing protein [Vicinamibacterales bacterium]